MNKIDIFPFVLPCNPHDCIPFTTCLQMMRLSTQELEQIGGNLLSVAHYGNYDPRLKLV